MSLRRMAILSAVLLACAGTLTGLVAAAGTHGFVQQVDGIWLHWMIDTRWLPLVVVAVALDIVGSAAVMGLVWVAVVAFLAARRRWRALTGFVAAVALTEVCTWTIKEAFDRPRPPTPLVATGEDSFLSAHASAATVTAVATVLVLGPRHCGRWLAGAFLFAAAMAWSRTYLAAHWLSDVVAGGLFAAAFALGAPLVSRALGHRSERREEPKT